MLYLVRHGATRQPPLRDPGDLSPATPDEWQLDYSLSERGVAESRALVGRLDALGPPDRVLSSPRRRTLETASNAGFGSRIEIDERLHEWHGDEPVVALHDRVRWLLDVTDEGTAVVFTHGGFIRAVMAGLVARDDVALFERVFHDFRRSVSVWNGSITLIGHGPGGLEVLAVNLCPAIDELTGARSGEPLP